MVLKNQENITDPSFFFKHLNNTVPYYNTWIDEVTKRQIEVC